MLLLEINEHKENLRIFSGLSEIELNKSISLITAKIRFIDAQLINPQIFIDTQNILREIDEDDTEFVALTNHIKGKLWTGDKALIRGLSKKGWNKFIRTKDLYQLIIK